MKMGGGSGEAISAVVILMRQCILRKSKSRGIGEGAVLLMMISDVMK